MTCHGGARAGRSAGRPALEVAEIFRRHGEEYRRTHALSAEQLRVMGDIETCRTAVRGGHLDTCDHCGHQAPSYNSCGNRHCPKCQALSQAKWIAERKERILPTHYFHLVFTLPEELRSVARCNRRALFNMLFSATAETLLELGRDPKHLGATLGITAVLHTWTRTLDFHPHLHCIVTGGGLDEKNNRWVGAKPDFLFPAKALSRLFRGKFLAALTSAYDKGDLEFAGACTHLSDPESFAALKDGLYQKEWVVHVKPTFAGPGHVFEYLGRYTHRVAISNQRLMAMDNHGVTFSTKDGKTATLKPPEFIRRFLMHVLPKRYAKIRHYGLNSASNAKTKLERARRLIEAGQPTSDEQATGRESLPHIGDTWLEQMLALTGVDPSVCPRCGIGRMVRTRIAKGTILPLNPEPENSS